MAEYPSSSGARKGLLSGVNWSSWFPPVTSRTFLSHYLPASGAISHTLYTVHIFNPSILSNIFPTADLAVSNTILFNANIGLGFYVYFRRHLHKTQPWERVEFSVIATTIFNFGSLLAAVLIKALVPAKTATWLKSTLAVSLSAYLLSRAFKYLSLIDARSTRGSPSPTRSRRAGSIASSVMSRPTSTINDSISIVVGGEADLRAPFQNNRKLSLLTPTITNTEEPSEADNELAEEEWMQTSPRKKNYKYLHSYALGNLNQSREKSSILRRTTKFQQQQKPPIFVSPETLVRGMDTPPPSPVEKAKKSVVTTSDSEESEIMPRAKSDSDFVEVHAPLALIPLVLFSFVKWKTILPLPIIETLRFIFVTTFRR